MRPRRTGHIVNVASMAGKAGFPGAATYCATKHAVFGLSEAVHLELRGTGVEVSCVMPAIVRTELASGLSEARMIKSVSPEEVAKAIVDALRKPRFDVFVPKSLDAMGRITRLLSRKAGEWIARARRRPAFGFSGPLHRPRGLRSAGRSECPNGRFGVTRTA
jgi:short-subunit dehydrogenase